MELECRLFRSISISPLLIVVTEDCASVEEAVEEAQAFESFDGGQRGSAVG